MYKREQIEEAVKSKGYTWFEDVNNKGYDVNIVGVRNSAPGTKVTDLFDDMLTVSYKVDGRWVFKQWPATTDPGRRGVIEYGNANGVARMVPGQYRRSHTIGLHQGKYEALRQVNPVKIYRDSNKDMNYDTNKITEGVFGINIHKAGVDTKKVSNWSEGCTVFKKEDDFNEFMKICKEAAKLHGAFFTYTLIESKDLA